MPTNEPGTWASITAGGVSLVTLNGFVYDILIEAGASPRLSSAIVGILMVLASVGAALWARARTVTLETSAATAAALASATAAVALALPASAGEKALNIALDRADLPPVEIVKETT